MLVLRSLFIALVTLALSGSSAGAQQKGWLGTEVKDLTQEEAEALGWEGPRGAKIVKPQPGSPADLAGLQADDIIVSLDSLEVESMQSFVAAVGAKRPGAEVKIRLLRSGKERRLTATLVGRPESADAAAASFPNLSQLQLMLDTGGHSAILKGVAFTRDGRYIVSAGNDKVIRIWDWRKGETVRRIRGDVGQGPEGKIYAMALSPDGKLVAVGGWMRNNGVRLFDFGTGDLVATLAGITGATNSVAFSADSKRLIAGSGAGDAAIIWNVETREIVHRLQGHQGEIYAVGFTPDGQRAVTGSYDRTLALWDVSTGELLSKLEAHKEKVHALAINSKDGTIASGSYDGEIRLWNVSGNGPPKSRIFANQGAAVGSLTFDPSGTRLLSTCGRGQPCQDYIWDVRTGKEIATHKIDHDIVTAGAFSPDGTLAATGGGSTHEIHVWRVDSGVRVEGARGEPVSLRGNGRPSWATGFSIDSTRMAWGYTWRYWTHEGRNPLEFELRLPTADSGLGVPEALSPSPSEEESEAKGDGDFSRARRRHGALALHHREGGPPGNTFPDGTLDIREGETTLGSIERGSTNGFDHRAYSFAPDGRTVVSGGSNGVLATYGRDGSEIGQFIGHEGDIWAVTPSPDGRYLVSGSADQTVRLWNLETRELIVTLFHAPAPDGGIGEWVMWTPEGYYTGSPGADRMVGWQVSKGHDKTPDYVGADQLRRHLNRPDIVEKAIVLASAKAAVKQSEGTNFKLSDLLSRPAPKIRILSPAPGEFLKGGSAIVRLDVEGTPDAIKRFTLRVNGRVIGEQAATSAEGAVLFNVPLADGENRIAVMAENDIGETPAEVIVRHDGEGALDTRGTLHVLAIGVDKYPNMPKVCGATGKESCDLTWPGADARAFAASIEGALGPQHEGRVKTQILAEGPGATPPTAANIRKALSAVRNAGTKNDTVVVFVAGHGVNDRADYLFMPTDASRDGQGWSGDSVVPWVELERIVSGTRGRRLLFVDTCHSAGAYNAKLGNAAYHNDITAFTATGIDESALEIKALKQGLFTYAIMKGLAGEADEGGDKLVRVEELGAFLKKKTGVLIDEHLKNYNKKRPVPVLHKGRDAEDHVLARL